MINGLRLGRQLTDRTCCLERGEQHGSRHLCWLINNTVSVTVPFRCALLRQRRKSDVPVITDEYDPAGIIPGKQVIQCAVKQLFTMPKHHHAAAKGGNILHVMSRQQYCRTVLFVFMTQEITQRQLADGIQSDGRFVQKEQLGAVQKRSAYFLKMMDEL